MVKLLHPFNSYEETISLLDFLSNSIFLLIDQQEKLRAENWELRGTEIFWRSWTNSEYYMLAEILKIDMREQEMLKFATESGLQEEYLSFSKLFL